MPRARDLFDDIAADDIARRLRAGNVLLNHTKGMARKLGPVHDMRATLVLLLEV
jgi:hypothetical protein